ncbi:MAG: nodulation protein NfeD [candidate division Zixibacteria bacterium]|nr:nodulation protein NfeD [candidate division Zixibacteria bacterium]
MRKYFILLILLSLTMSFCFAEPDSTETDEVVVFDNESDKAFTTVYHLTIDGPIGTVTADRVIDAVKKVEEKHADLLLITMDTPGGFNDSFWDITKAIMNCSVPVAVYVYPVGAKAASAGVYIAYSAHIAAMAPSTNIGAAHVVSGSGQPIDSVLMEKIMNDAVASLQAMAERNGRNAEWAEDAARESVSITDKEALELNVVNFLAEDIDDLLEQIDGFEVTTVLGKKIVNTKNPLTIPIKKTFIQSFLDIITSPNIAFILFSLGGLGLVLELYNPGSILPGVVGGICIILAFYSFRTLPINYAGLLLIIFAIILFILEVKIASHGLLAIGGVVSVIIGGMMLIDTVDPSLQVSKTVIFTVALLLAGFIVGVGILAYKARVSKPTTGVEGLIGETGTVKENIDSTDKSGYVFVAGELWEATSDASIDEGTEIIVLAVDGMKIKVKPKV